MRISRIGRWSLLLLAALPLTIFQDEIEAVYQQWHGGPLPYALQRRAATTLPDHWSAQRGDAAVGSTPIAGPNSPADLGSLPSNKPARDDLPSSSLGGGRVPAGRDRNPLTLRGPSASNSVPANELANQMDRLKQLGATYLLVRRQPVAGLRYECYCEIAAANATAVRRFQASASQASDAAAKVVAQVEQWTQPH